MIQFHHVPHDTIDVLDRDWLEQIPSVKKADHAKMVKKVEDGEWKLWRLGKPADGIGVTYPWEGKLFVYYLRGLGLFGTLTKEDLLALARREGLNGLAAETSSYGMKKILKRLGFLTVLEEPGHWTLELPDGRQ